MGSAFHSKSAMAFAWMLVGSLCVFSVVTAMNGSPPKKAADEEKVVTSFRIEKAKSREKMQVERRRVPKQQNRQKSPRAPMPKLAGVMGGMSFGIPDFDATRVGSLSDRLLGDMDNVVMTEDAVDEAPTPRLRRDVAYPPAARSKGVTGFVTLHVLVDTNGSVESVRVLEAEPKGVFENAAVDAVEGWKFDPATYQGRPVKVWARQTVQFRLI